MKQRKWNKKWILVGAAVVLILLLLLTMCTGKPEGEPEEIPTAATEQTTVPTQMPTESIPEETTVPTEETTEPTEETTEPTEEETTPPTTNSTEPTEDTEDYGQPEEYVEFPDPGTPENPYVEVAEEYPAEVASVNIPKGEEVSYVITGSAGSVITIQPGVTVKLGKDTYTANDLTGPVMVDLTKLVEDPVITISRANKAAASCLLTLEEGLGGAGNPEILVDPVETAVSLLAGDKNGYHYKWTSTITGQVELTLKEEEAVPVAEEEETQPTQPVEEIPELEILVTAGEKSFKLSEATDGKLVIDALKGQDVLIRVIAKPFTDGSYPAIEETLLWNLLPDLGTQENPAVLESIESITVTLAEGNAEGYFLQWTAPYGGTLELTAAPETKAQITLTNSVSGDSQQMPETGVVAVEAQKDDVLIIHAVMDADETGAIAGGEVVLTGQFLAVAGISELNPIVISDPAEAETFTVDARQTLYFSGMVHEMIAKVDNAAGVSLRCGEDTAWGDLTGTAELELPEAEDAQPVVFSVTSKNEKELTLTFAYPEGHAKNPAQLILGENKVQLAEENEDGYRMTWTADCDGLLTITVDGRTGWQYQLDGEERCTSADETVTASRTLEVTSGKTVELTLWTLAAEENAALPAGQLIVTADFVDPLLGTEDKPIVLDSEKNTVTIPAGQTLHYTAGAADMILTFDGKDVTLTHGGEDHLSENGSLTLLCVDNQFRITNGSEKDQTCTLTFAYPEGHRENPLDLVLGENTARLEEGALDGVSFGWKAESAGLLTVTMAEDASWQYIISNETAGISGVVHTSEDQPKEASETLEVAAGDEILVIVNTFDLEHPLNTPAGEVVFTAMFMDPTLGMEGNPIWLNLEDKITIPAGKTMYCTAKADGMVMTLKGAGAVVSHNGNDHKTSGDSVSLLCSGNGTFGHPVFAITNTDAQDRDYTVSFEYPEGHFLAPAQLKLGKTAVDAADLGKCGYYFLWTAEKSGTFTFTMDTEEGWKYHLANLTAAEAGECHCDEDEESQISESVTVEAGQQLRIMVGLTEAVSGTQTVPIRFTAEFVPENTEE